MQSTAHGEEQHQDMLGYPDGSSSGELGLVGTKQRVSSVTLLLRLMLFSAALGKVSPAGQDM